MRLRFSVSILALDLPKPMAPFAPPCIWRMKKIQIPTMMMMGSSCSRMAPALMPPGGLTLMSTLRASSRLTRSSWLFGVAEAKLLPSASFTTMRGPAISTDFTPPPSILPSSWV